MTRPQERHADLGLDPDADHTPEMRKASDSPAKKSPEATDQTSRKDQITMSIAQTSDTRQTPTGRPAPVNPEEVSALMAYASEHGLTFSMQNTLRGTVYRAWAQNDKQLAWTYDFTEARDAVHNYWPDFVSTRALELGVCGWVELVEVSVSPAFADEETTIFLNNMQPQTITVDQAAALADALLEAVAVARGHDGVAEARPA